MKKFKDLKYLKNLRQAKEQLESGEASNLDMEGLVEGFAHGNRAKTIGSDIEKGYRLLINEKINTEKAGEQLGLEFDEITIESEIVTDTTLDFDITTGAMFALADKLGVSSKYIKQIRGKELFLKAYAAGTLEADLKKHVVATKQNKFLVTRTKNK